MHETPVSSSVLLRSDYRSSKKILVEERHYDETQLNEITHSRCTAANRTSAIVMFGQARTMMFTVVFSVVNVHS